MDGGIVAIIFALLFVLIIVAVVAVAIIALFKFAYVIVPVSIFSWIFGKFGKNKSKSKKK